MRPRLPAVLAVIMLATIGLVFPAAADVSGDAKADLIAIRDSDGQLARWFGDGSGSFDSAGDWSGGWEAYDQISITLDINGDDKRDVIGVRKSDGRLARWWGNGSGGFTFAGVLGPGWNAYRELTAAGDINGDGKPDLVAIRSADATMTRWWGDGAGNFTPGGDMGHGWSGYHDLTAGDFNNDGRPDLFVVRGSDGKLARYWGNDSGGYTAGTDLGPGWNAYQQLAGGADINGDGKQDLVAVRTSDGRMARWYGNGSGGLGTGTILGVGWGAYNNLSMSPATTDERDGKVYHLTSVGDGRLVSAEVEYTGADDGMLRARARAVGSWELFRLVSIDGGYAIWSQRAGAYVSAELGYTGGDYGMLRARASTIGPWERFVIEVNSDSTWSLKSMANGMYVSAEVDYAGGDEGMLRARATAIGDWEKFRPNQRIRRDALDNPIFLVPGYDRDGVTPGHDCQAYWGGTADDYRNGDSPTTIVPPHTVGFYAGDTNCSDRVFRGDRNASITELGKALARWIYDRYSHAGHSVDIVAHSMGGLIVRAALTGTQRHEPGFPPYLYIEDVVTMGTPHGGGVILPFFCSANQQCEDMIWDSDFLNWLDDNPQGELGTDWTLLAAETDEIGVGSSLNMVAGHKIRYFLDTAVPHSKWPDLVNDGTLYHYKRCDGLACNYLTGSEGEEVYSFGGSPVFMSRNALYWESAA